MMQCGSILESQRFRYWDRSDRSPNKGLTELFQVYSQGALTYVY